MNDNERKICEKYEAQGYNVIHVGVPDFILLKDGEIEFVEVKAAADRLRESQLRAIALLEKHGFSVRVERVPKIHRSSLLQDWRENQTPNQSPPDHTRPVQTTPSQSKPVQSTPRQTKSRPGQSNQIQTTPNHPRPSHKEMI